MCFYPFCKLPSRFAGSRGCVDHPHLEPAGESASEAGAVAQPVAQPVALAAAQPVAAAAAAAPPRADISSGSKKRPAQGKGGPKKKLKSGKVCQREDCTKCARDPWPHCRAHALFNECKKGECTSHVVCVPPLAPPAPPWSLGAE